MVRQFLLSVISGKITNPFPLRKAIAMLPDGWYMFKIEPKTKRSTSQNAYFHGVVVPLVYQGLKDAGFDEIEDHEDAKMVVKSLFLERIIPDRRTGEGIKTIRNTHTLTTVEFSEFVDKIIKWASEYLGVQIPLPNEF